MVWHLSQVSSLLDRPSHSHAGDSSSSGSSEPHTLQATPASSAAAAAAAVVIPPRLTQPWSIHGPASSAAAVAGAAVASVNGAGSGGSGVPLHGGLVLAAASNYLAAQRASSLGNVSRLDSDAASSIGSLPSPRQVELQVGVDYDPGLIRVQKLWFTHIMQKFSVVGVVRWCLALNILYVFIDSMVLPGKIVRT